MLSLKVKLELIDNKVYSTEVGTQTASPNEVGIDSNLALGAGDVVLSVSLPCSPTLGKDVETGTEMAPS